uniref:DUF4358 domain-containing protein n=1 Tax=Agathobacter sp. TaxID=2021311 RepID=UPI00405748D5
MKKLVLGLVMGMMLTGILAGCGNGGSSAKDIPVEDILQAVKDAYGESYLPNAEMDAATLDEMYDIDMELMESYVAEMPMIGFHPDRVIIAKAVGGKGAELEEEFLDLKEYLIEDSFMYPANMAKTQAAQVVRNGDYVAFLLVGAANENMEASEEEQLKFAQEETQKAVDAFNSVFE